MRLVNWAQSFKEQPTCEHILDKVAGLERAYWVWLIVSSILTLFGIFVILIAPSHDLKQHALGIFLALDGSISIMLLKIWVHVRLAMYRILWDSQNRMAAELRRSEAQDL